VEDGAKNSASASTTATTTVGRKTDTADTSAEAEASSKSRRGFRLKQNQKQELASIPEDRQKKFQSELRQSEQEDKSKRKTNNDGNDKDNHDDDEQMKSSPLWSGANAGWTLTWPIWHMLPHSERKSLANQYGYKSIGEFEEYMSLQQAMGDSTTAMSVNPLLYQPSSSIQKAYPNDAAYLQLLDKKDPAITKSEGKNDENTNAKLADDADDDDGETSTDASENADGTVDETGLTVQQLMELGGDILVLPSELLHRVFSFLPVDTYGVLALVSPHWKHLTRTEPVYKRLCERLYLNQSKRRQLHVNRFGGSYRRMLEIRPRVRAAGGCYVLKYSQIKKVQRDMWTEVPVGAILESVYYRYFYFQEDGRVVYALTSSPPHEMFRRLLKLVLHKDATDSAAVWGDFVVQKDACTVIAKQQHTTVRFDLTIQPQSSFGRFAAMTLDQHFSSKSANFEDWSEDRVEYKVPTEIFRFIRDPRL
jgi:F-box protein 9